MSKKIPALWCIEDAKLKEVVGGYAPVCNYTYKDFPVFKFMTEDGKPPQQDTPIVFQITKDEYPEKRLYKTNIGVVHHRSDDEDYYDAGCDTEVIDPVFEEHRYNQRTIIRVWVIQNPDPEREFSCLVLDLSELRQTGMGASSYTRYDIEPVGSWSGSSATGNHGTRASLILLPNDKEYYATDVRVSNSGKVYEIRRGL